MALLLTTGLLVTATVMFILWLIHIRIGNAGIVDIGWAYSLGLLALLYAFLGKAPSLPRWSLAAMAAIWSYRLGTHLFRRVINKPEEGRYQQLRQQWPRHTNLKFLLFFEFQALLDVILATPFLLVSVDSTQTGRLDFVRIAGIVIWLIAVLGESIADAQLRQFKRTASSKDVCQTGLWNYSRHPNYFFEWLVWIGWSLFALPAHLGWISFISPVAMLFFLLRITGIPATEAQAVRTKGQTYLDYQQSTSPFIPWFKKQDTGASL